MDQSSIGDRMKEYEKRYIGQRAMPLIPTIARLDGRAFHTFCQGLDKPFDEDFVEIMENTTKRLVEETNAIIGHTQSDEITLIFYTDNAKSQIFFDGKLYKMTSVLASMCTAYFAESKSDRLDYMYSEAITSNIYDKKIDLLISKPPGLFDCRVFQVPTKTEAVNCLIWREQDATRNSILSVGQAHFSHKQLHGKNVKEIQEMLFQEHGINWSQDFKDNLKRGSYFRRELVQHILRQDEISKIPENKIPEDLLVQRHEIKRLELPILAGIENRVKVIFDNEKPILKE